MKILGILFLTFCLSLSVFILEAQQIFPYMADSKERLVGKYSTTNPNPNYEVSKRTGSAKLLDSVNYFSDFTYFDSISGRYKRKFGLQMAIKYYEDGNLWDVYYYPYNQPIRISHFEDILTWDSEERIAQKTSLIDSCVNTIAYYTYDLDSNLIKTKNYSKGYSGCLDTTQKTFYIDQNEYTYDNGGKMTSQTYSNNMLGYTLPNSHYEYKYVNDSLPGLVYYSNHYIESEKSWVYTNKTQLVYDSTGLLQKEIRFLNIAPISQDSLWYSNDTTRYYYTLNEYGQMESMQRFKLTDNVDRRYTYYANGVIDSIVEKNVSNTITSKYDKDGYIRYTDQIANNTARFRTRYEYHYVGDVVISGIDEKTENNRLVIYPNPAVQQITIALNPMETEHIVRKTEILNLSGQTVWTDNSSYLQKTIDLSALKPGTYFIRLTTSNGIINKKLLKM